MSKPRFLANSEDNTEQSTTSKLTQKFKENGNQTLTANSNNELKYWNMNGGDETFASSVPENHSSPSSLHLSEDVNQTQKSLTPNGVDNDDIDYYNLTDGDRPVIMSSKR